MSANMISVVNYGVSNVGSMMNMLHKLGIAAQTITTAAGVEEASKIILPGVGSFDNGIKALSDLGLTEPLRNRAREGVPLLGVCLGMQMLGRGSEEGTMPGLDLVPGRCVRFKPDSSASIRVPHMGWSEPAFLRETPLSAGLEKARFYFVHSYYFVCDREADELARARYGVEFTAAVHRENVWGVQFHPEKSHRFGMSLLRNFAAI